jgi:hypothetical protein
LIPNTQLPLIWCFLKEAGALLEILKLVLPFLGGGAVGATLDEWFRRRNSKVQAISLIERVNRSVSPELEGCFLQRHHRCLPKSDESDGRGGRRLHQPDRIIPAYACGTALLPWRHSSPVQVARRVADHTGVGVRPLRPEVGEIVKHGFSPCRRLRLCHPHGG